MKTRFLFAALFLLALSDSAFGCWCTTPDVHQAVGKARAVFVGEVIQVKNRRAVFRVEHSWKGVATSRVVLFMGGSVVRHTKKYNEVLASTSCDFDFEQGEKYLVYASSIGGHLRAWVCSRTQKLASAEEDLKVLGPGTPPRNAPGRTKAMKGQHT